MAHHQARVAGADRAGGEDEIALLDREHLAAHKTRHAAPSHGGDDRRESDGVRAEQDRHQDEQEDGWDRKHGVHQPHQNVVDPATVITGHHADRRADRQGQRNRQESHSQGDPRPPDQPGQAVAAELVAAQQMRRARARKGLVQVDGLRLIVGQDGREHGRENGNDRQHQDEHPSGHTETIRAETLPRLVPIALRGARCGSLNPGGRHVQLGDPAGPDHLAFIRIESLDQALRRAGPRAGCRR